MTTYDTMELIMLYVGYDQNSIKAYNAMLKTIDEDSDYPLGGAKSIRLESDFSAAAKAVRNNHFCGDLSIVDNSGKNIVGTGYIYNVPKETGYRYLIASKSITKSFAARMFYDERTWNKFVANHKITVKDRFEYLGFKMIRYEAAESAVLRYAALIDRNIDLTAVRKKLLAKLPTSSSVDTDNVSVEHTGYFNA